MLVLQAAREVVEEEGFDDLLDSVRDRVDEIESLHRTRELTVRFVKPSRLALFFFLCLARGCGLLICAIVFRCCVVQGLGAWGQDHDDGG